MLASDRALSLLVAMESALDDNRYEVGPHSRSQSCKSYSAELLLQNVRVCRIPVETLGGY